MSAVATPTTRREIFDRARLLIDLDEATDPGEGDTLLVVIGLRQLGDCPSALLTHVRDRVKDLVGDGGTVYCTRVTELCVLVNDRGSGADRLLAAIQGGFGLDPEISAIRVSLGVVELPDEAEDALSALALADRRMTSADGPVRYD